MAQLSCAFFNQLGCLIMVSFSTSCKPQSSNSLLNWILTDLFEPLSSGSWLFNGLVTRQRTVVFAAYVSEIVTQAGFGVRTAGMLCRVDVVREIMAQHRVSPFALPWQFPVEIAYLPVGQPALPSFFYRFQLEKKKNNKNVN